MVIPKSKFFSKFSISKWSFVNLELFKSSKLSKYNIHSHRTGTLMLKRLGGNIPSSTKVHTWCHDGDNVLMSPSCALCSHHPCFVQKTFLVSAFFFPSFHNPTYTHNGIFFSLLHTPTYTLHYLAFASSHRCTSLHFILFLHLHIVVVFYCNSSSSNSITLHQHHWVVFLMSLHVLFLYVFPCFVAFPLCMGIIILLWMVYPPSRPFKGSSFLSPYLHCCNFFLVVFACFMVLLGLLQVIIFYYKHQRLVFPLFFLLFVATFFSSIIVITFLVPTFN